MTDDWMRRRLTETADQIPDSFELPSSVLRRARRRMMLTSASMGLLLAGGFFVGAMALGQTGPRTVAPADPVSEGGEDRPETLDGTIVLSGATEGGGFDLFTLDVSSGEIKPLLESPVLKDSPAWSPDGDSVVYQAYRGESASSGDAIFMLRRGESPRELVDVGTSDAHPAWSPDGSRVAFDTPEGPSIHVFDLTDESVTEVVKGEHPAWSPDGSEIAFVRNSSIYVIDLASAGVREVSGSEGAHDVAWSPDGRFLAFSNFDGNEGQIFVLDERGGDPRVLTEGPGAARAPEWSPTGEWVAHVLIVEGHSRIAAIHRDGGEPIMLTSSTANYFEPNWRR